MKAKKILVVLLIIALLFFAGTNSSSINTIDDLAYVVALGFDKGSNGLLKMSFQIAIPSSSSSGSSKSSSSSQSSSSITNTIECNTIESGINLIDSYVSKKINLSHCKVLVFSEELASTGIANYVYSLMNNIEIRPTCNVIISQCNADYFLTNSSPMLEQLSARYYEIAKNSEKNTGYTETIKLKDFFSDLNDSFTEPYAILGNISSADSSGFSSGTNQIYNLDDSSYSLNNESNSSDKNVETLAIAAFKDGKIVGELDEIESICHLIIINKLKNATISIPSPFEDSKYISLNLYNSKCKNTVEIINGNPYIECNISINCKVMTSTSNSNYLTPENSKKIEDFANSYIKSHIDDYLYKTSKEFDSDISSFGKYAVKNFSNWNDWVNYGWINNYRNAFFKTTVNTNLNSSYLIIGT